MHLSETYYKLLSTYTKRPPQNLSLSILEFGKEMGKK
uniref:Uncharacterized protein n=1 Tax=Rhizophora mucronata TaxID=61149 RepID=A0A2P2IUV9_RHIMU